MGKKISDEDLLEKLRDLVCKNEYVVNRIIDEDDSMPSSIVYRRRFGSLDKALEIIGVDVVENRIKANANTGKPKQYKREDLIKIMVDYNKNVKFPTQRDFKPKNGLPCHNIYVNEFGSFKNALKECGIEIPEDKLWLYNREEYTKEGVIESFKNQLEKHMKENDGKLLTDNDIDRLDMVSSNVIYKHFKTFDEIYKAVGIDKVKYNDDLIKTDMKNKYIEIRGILGRPPHSRDLERFSRSNNEGRYYSCSTYLHHFGSMEELHKLMGDLPTCLGRSMTKEECLEALYKLYLEIGVVPSQKDSDNCPYTPMSNWYRFHCGSFPNAIREIGLIPRSSKQPLITPKGTKTYSGYEYKLALLMEKYEIEYKKEELYSDYIPNFDKKYRFDYSFKEKDKTVFVEIFGITGNEKYDIKTEEKIQLCKDNNLTLISLFPRDMCGSFEEIYDKYFKKYIN